MSRAEPKSKTRECGFTALFGVGSIKLLGHPLISPMAPILQINPPLNILAIYCIKVWCRPRVKRPIHSLYPIRQFHPVSVRQVTIQEQQGAEAHDIENCRGQKKR